MAEKIGTVRKGSEKKTKQEMLEAYQDAFKQLEEKRADELNPQKRLEEKAAAEAVKTAGALSPEEIDRGIGRLKADIGRMLAEVSERLAAEDGKFRSLEKAIETKQAEIQELYGIEKAAATLAALIESQNQKRREFEVELERQKAELAREVEVTRTEWDLEQKQHDQEIKGKR